MPAIDWSTKPDPIRLATTMWPHSTFYDKQEEVIYSTLYNDVTVVTAGNKLGKDYVAGFICLYHFLVFPECRVITTSVKDDHLRVLWGEIGRWVQTATQPMEAGRGGPLIINHREIRKMRPPIAKRRRCEISYLRGMVSERGEGLAGHHAAHTLGVIDEASGVDDEALVQMEGWAKRILIFGNPNPCSNFFKRLIKSGDLLAEDAA